MQLHYALIFEPGDVFRWDDIDQVKTKVLVSNPAKNSLENQINRTQLFINGRAAISWSLTIQNGKRPRDWDTVPPGKSVEMEWQNLAQGLFPEKGDYKLTLKLEEEVLVEKNVVVE